MLPNGLLESPSARLLLACALSLLAHVLLIFNLPRELTLAQPSIAPHPTRMSVEFRVPEAPRAFPEAIPEVVPKTVSPTPAIEPPANVEQPPEETPPVAPAEPTRQLQSVESLRAAWRSDATPGTATTAPFRLTDQPGLNSEARAYLASWQREVQRIGRLNFPTDDDGDRIRGSLRLLVGIEHDGALAYVRVTESSGKARLDAAARHIVELAAPFAPVPSSLRRGDAPLEIERTWRIGASLVRL